MFEFYDLHQYTSSYNIFIKNFIKPHKSNRSCPMKVSPKVVIKEPYNGALDDCNMALVCLMINYVYIL